MSSKISVFILLCPLLAAQPNISHSGGENQQINIVWPIDNGFVENDRSLSTSLIYWTGIPKDSVDFFYSIDNGISWQEADTPPYYSSDSTIYWRMPDTINVKCKFKIVETGNPSNYDVNEVTLYSSDYNFTCINEIFQWIRNNGTGSHDVHTDAGGLYWPGGANGTISATFADGLLWSGIVDGQKRAAGSYFSNSALRPGTILSNGLPSNPTDSLFKIWKLRRNWEYLPAGAERDMYEFNYNNWPAEIGAPWIDINSDGIFTRGIDVPKHIGEETLWFVANDLDTAKSYYIWGSLPMGLEFQVTTWGHSSEELKDVVFKKYKLINKGSNIINDLILGFWSDDDLGDANDDYPGCDSSLNIGYMFNGNNFDFNYGTPPPAIGHMIIQGPIIPAAQTDSARYGNGWKKEFKNLRMNAYSPGFKNSQGLPADPSAGYYGTIQVYYYLRGLLGNGDSLINPITGQGTIFPLSGDPESGTGWYCGNGWPGGPPPRDSRSLIPGGPFNMAPGDTNEFVAAVFLQKGNNNLNSVTKLKQYAAFLQEWYNTDMITNVEDPSNLLPAAFSLSQNYPNPFNPSTTLEYYIDHKSKVNLTIFDILGRNIKTLVNEINEPGEYKVNFNASNPASGVYIYRLQSNEQVLTKKFILLK